MIAPNIQNFISGRNHAPLHSINRKVIIMKIIGITGSSGSGKTTATKILSEELKAKTIDADEIVKQMQQKGIEYYEKIVEVFGGEILQEDGSLNRKKLAEIIFQDELKKEKLDNLTYKYVVEEIKNQVKNAQEKYVIIDAPLLIEGKLNEICNAVIAVVSSQEDQIKRICKRDNIEEKNAKARINAQKANEFYKINADFIVENNGGEYDKFVGRIRKLVQKLQ